MAQFDLALPKFGAGDLDDEKQRRKIMNYLVKLDEQLRFVLNNLDTENFTETFQQVIVSGGGGGSGESSESLKALEEEINRLSTKVTQTANEIALKASAEELNELGDLMRRLNAEFKVLAGEISTKVSKEEYNALKGTVDSHSTSIKQTADQIALKADKKTVDTLSGTVSEHSAQFKVTAEQISSTVERVDTLDGVVQKQGTAITQTAEKIESKAEKSVVDALGNTVSKHSTAITQTAEKIESKAEASVVNALGETVAKHESAITQTPKEIRMAVESVQIGGRNLLKAEGMQFGGSCALWNLESWHSRNGLRIGMTGQGSVSFEDIYISPGDYTLSFYGWRWATDANPTLYFDLKSADGSFEHNVIATKVEDTSQGGSVKKYIGTLHVDTYSGKVKPRFVVLDSFSTGDVGITEWKLEQGNKATDWSPAPEDTDVAIAEVSAELVTQAGVIAANAQKIETVNQAAGAAQDTANAAQNAANGAQNTASGAVTRVTKAEEKISAVEGAITSMVSKEEFDELGRLVSKQETKIEQTDEQVLILAGKTVGGRNYIVNSKGPYVATGTGERQWLWLWRCASVEEAASLYGKEVTISFDYETAITSGAFGVLTNVTWQSVEAFDSYSKTGHVSKTMVINNATTTAATFLYIDGTWTGSVTFSNIKVEIGNTATDWSPHPDDPASGVNAGGVVRVDQTGVHMSGGTIDMETADGDEYIHIRSDGISASSLSAPNVAKRYSGPGTLYVNPNATSAQIAAGNYFRSLSDALATINNRMLDYNVFIYLTSGISDYANAVVKGVYGYGGVIIYGRGATLYGTMTVNSSHAQVQIEQLNVAIPSGVDQAAYTIKNTGCVYVWNCTMSGNHRAFTVESGGLLDARNCTFKVNADNSAYVLRATASFENCIGNGQLLCHRGYMTAAGKVPINGATFWECCVPNNTSSLVPTAADGTPAAPVISTATYNYTSSDSYAGRWGIPNQDAAQGVIRTDSSGTTAAIYGTIWFDAAAIRSALNGKAIKQASLRLTMLKGYGRDTAVSVQLYGTNTAYSGRSGQPALTTSYGTIGTTEPGAVSEITIPAAVISDIVSGTIQALVLKSDDSELYKDRDYSKNYARFAGSASADGNTCPRLTVVYQ